MLYVTYFHQLKAGDHFTSGLPKKTGLEVLAEIKSYETLTSIPVVILTASQDEQDVERTYDLHANCFITKPVDLVQFARVVECIREFWFTVVVLPPNK